jgi:hypothetical protein
MYPAPSGLQGVDGLNHLLESPHPVRHSAPQCNSRSHRELSGIGRGRRCNVSISLFTAGCLPRSDSPLKWRPYHDNGGQNQETHSENAREPVERSPVITAQSLSYEPRACPQRPAWPNRGPVHHGLPLHWCMPPRACRYHHGSSRNYLPTRLRYGVTRMRVSAAEAGDTIGNCARSETTDTAAIFMDAEFVKRAVPQTWPPVILLKRRCAKLNT